MSTQEQQHTKILSFLRFVGDTDQVELVTWSKAKDGTKHVKKEPYRAGTMDKAVMRASPHQEITE